MVGVRMILLAAMALAQFQAQRQRLFNRVGLAITTEPIHARISDGDQDTKHRSMETLAPLAAEPTYLFVRSRFFCVTFLIMSRMCI